MSHATLRARTSSSEIKNGSPCSSPRSSSSARWADGAKEGSDKEESLLSEKVVVDTVERLEPPKPTSTSAEIWIRAGLLEWLIVVGAGS